MDKNTSEIAKLTERIARDPKSKLFVPLAEEYKKVGDIDMAVHVLSEGLKHNPGYVTAKSFLGKLLIEKGDYAGAIKEFEDVVQAIPDNLLAHRKLGDLHVLQNNPSAALKEYKIVLSSNPGDKELADLVSQMEPGPDAGMPLQQQKSVPDSKPEMAKKPAAEQKAERVARAAVSSPNTQQPSAPLQAAEPQPVKPHAAESAVPEPPAPAPEVVKPREPEEPAALPETVREDMPALSREPEEEAEEVLVVELLDEVLPSVEAARDDARPVAVAEDAAPQEVIEEAVEAGVEFPEPQEAEETSAFSEEVSEPEAIGQPAKPFDDETHTVAAELDAGAGPGATDQSDDFTTDTLAELYIAQGFFEKAIDIYERMLVEHPESLGLQNKLDRVREMAGEAAVTAESEGTPAAALEEPVEAVIAAPSAAGFSPAEVLPEPEPAVVEEVPAEIPETPEERVISEEALEYTPPSVQDEAGDEIMLEAEILAEPEETPAAGLPDRDAEDIFVEAEEIPEEPVAEPSSSRGAAAFDVFASEPARDYVKEKPAFTDFEPREYIPPDAVPRKSSAQEVGALTGHAGAGRKETIDRLETWLKNIRKEK